MTLLCVAVTRDYLSPPQIPPISQVLPTPSSCQIRKSLQPMCHILKFGLFLVPPPRLPLGLLLHIYIRNLTLLPDDSVKRSSFLNWTVLSGSLGIEI